MKKTQNINMVFILIAIILTCFGCVDSNSDSDKDSGEVISGSNNSDPSGLSKKTIKEQVKAGIFSPYQLIQLVQPEVEVILDELTNPYATSGTG